MKSTAILIPARYGSTRFPGKPLALLDNVPMIKRVFDAASKSGLPTYVLTDDTRIADMFEQHQVIIDLAEYENGTERCAGAVAMRTLDEFDQFINVQGDMPDVTIDMIAKAQLQLKYYPVSTVFTDMPEEQQNDPNSVKMVRAGDQALWFGRGMTGYGLWHLGVYGYSKNALQCFPNLQIEQEERVEKLEQLRWLKNGWQIGCNSVYYNGVEINAPEDVESWHAK
jgi:3-deoxy-manno-octulosonate cytidylyltransferase (CMP-KDO synthetase)|tara:strand:+ start:869 stop:1543 length:675 start_codon:yes stop_codon:yes gene_type:complete